MNAKRINQPIKPSLLELHNRSVVPEPVAKYPHALASKKVRSHAYIAEGAGRGKRGWKRREEGGGEKKKRGF